MTIIKKETPNQYDLGGDIVAIVLHATLGGFEGASEWLMISPEERLKRTGKKSWSSAHVLFGRFGRVTQFAGLNRGTWHAGGVSNPSERAKDILHKNFWGTLENPNKYTLGFEFVAEYDIDKDGVIETWEKLYSAQQIKNCAEYILNIVEPELGIQFGDHNIITHKDITSYKPNLEVQRMMLLTELEKQRKAKETPQVVSEIVEPIKEVIISIVEGGKTRKYVCQPSQ